MAKTKIEWADVTWNFITGCTKISAGCKNCYAERMTKRLVHMCGKYKDGFDKVVSHPEVLSYPLGIQKPKRIFVNSMSDLYHKDVPSIVIKDAFDVMSKASHHTFLVLTKRPERMLKLHQKVIIPKNVFMGTTVEDKNSLHRIETLKKIKGANIKFISFEPLLEDLSLKKLDGIDWAIVGGESGHNARQMKIEWVENIFKVVKKENIPFFYKQFWGKEKKNCILNGKTYKEYPKV